MADAAATLISKCIGGDHRAVKKILTSHPEVVNLPAANPNLFGSTPIHFAAQNGRAEVVQILIKRGADVNKYNQRGKTALHFASGEIGTEAAVELLLRAGADANATTRDGKSLTPGHIAAQIGNYKVLNTLKLWNSDVHQRNAEGRTVLDLERIWRMERGYLAPRDIWFHALENNDLETVKAMLRTGEVDIEDRHENFHFKVTAITFCAMLPTDPAEAVSVLLAAGAFPDAVDERGRTALFYATQLGNVKVVRLLIKAGANVNLKDENGNTPLHVGFYYFFNPQIAADLLGHGANPLETNAAGDSPLKLSKMRMVYDVKSEDDFKEQFVHPVELRAAFLPFDPETTAFVRFVGLRRSKFYVRFLITPFLFLFTLLGVALVQPAIILGILSSRRGYSSILTMGLEDLLFSRYTLAAIPLFVIGIAGCILFISLGVPLAMKRGLDSQTIFAVIVTYLSILLLIKIMAILQAARFADFRKVEEPSAKLRLTLVNVIAVILMIVEFCQVFSLSFNDNVPVPPDSGEQQTHSAISSVGLVQFATTYKAAFFTALTALILWGLAGANMGLTLGTDSLTGIRTLFPFIGQTKLDYFFFDLIVPILTNTAYLPIVTNLFKSVSCTNVSPGRWLLVADPTIVCWQGEHILYAVTGMVGLLCYIPTATVFGAFFLKSYGFLDPKASAAKKFFLGPEDIKIVPLFVLIFRPLKSVLSAFAVFFYGNMWLYLVSTLIVYLSMFLTIVIVKPYRDKRSPTGTTGLWFGPGFAAFFNRWRSSTMLIVVWRVIMQMIAVAVNNPTSYATVHIQYAGIGFILFTMILIEIVIWKLYRKAEAAEKAQDKGAARRFIDDGTDNDGIRLPAMRDLEDVGPHYENLESIFTDGELNPLVALQSGPSAGGAGAEEELDVEQMITNDLGLAENKEFRHFHKLFQKQLDSVLRERERLRKQVATLSAELQRATQLNSRYTLDLTDLREQKTAMDTRLNDILAEKRDIIQLSADYKALNQRLEDSRDRATGMASEVEALRALVRIAEEEKRSREAGGGGGGARAAAELEENPSRIQALETLLDVAAKEKDRFKAEKRSLEEEFVAFKLQAAERDFERQSLSVEMSTLQRQVERLQRELDQHKRSR